MKRKKSAAVRKIAAERALANAQMRVAWLEEQNAAAKKTIEGLRNAGRNTKEMAGRVCTAAMLAKAQYALVAHESALLSTSVSELSWFLEGGYFAEISRRIETKAAK